MALFAWVGQVFDDNDGDYSNILDCLPAVFFFGELFVFELIFAYSQRGASHPVIQESFASYIEMHEKSPPFALPCNF